MNLQKSSTVPFYRIVMTGGPCGGKTTALARVYTYLNERGFEVMTCPETYTIYVTNGLLGKFYSTDGIATIIQQSVIQTQMTLEDSIAKVLRATGKPSVMICDRGVIDGAAYMPSMDDWHQLLQNQQNKYHPPQSQSHYHHQEQQQQQPQPQPQQNQQPTQNQQPQLQEHPQQEEEEVMMMTHANLRDNRYDAVFHMVSAAVGAEEFYTLENNKARKETVEEAQQLDQATQDAWLGHPHLYVFDNSTGFEGKMTRMINVMAKLVGLPSNLKRRSAKFLLLSQPLHQLIHRTFPRDLEYHIFDVEKVYLLSSSTSMSTSSSSSNSSSSCSNIPHDDHSKQQSLSSLQQNYSFIRKRTVCLEDTDDTSTSTNDTKRKKEPVVSGGTVYQLTAVEFTKDTGEMVEQKRIITEREYYAYYRTARDPKRHIIQQKRISFIWNMQSFCIHVYEKPLGHLTVLHAQVPETTNTTTTTSDDDDDDDDDNVHVDLPPFLTVQRRIYHNKEDDQQYGAYSISVIQQDESK